MNMIRNFDKVRQNMVEKQLKRRGITDSAVLEAMASVPRHSFVSIEYQNLAYKDTPLPIGYGQTISQPYIVAFTLQSLNLKEPKVATILEVGTGLGYQAAVLSRFVKQVYSVERIPELAAQAQQNLVALNYGNIRVSRGDGGYGWPKFGPFDGIIVSAAAPDVPAPLLAQLKPGGALVVPVGSVGKQRLLRITFTGEAFVEEILMPVAFVPLVGEHGWSETDSYNKIDPL
jgi:protein-L-isoaspartate(D-aspartate) O-methyltransferase